MQKTESLMAKICSYILKHNKLSYMKSKQEAEDYLERRKDGMDETDRTPLYFGEKYDKKRSIIYIHGGAYVEDFNLQHRIYCHILAYTLKIPVIALRYPLAPQHTYHEAYREINTFYDELTSQNRSIILVGDSAGGGLALSYTHYLKELGKKEPEMVIAISPWINLCMDRKIDDTQDPILKAESLKIIAEKWADDTDTKNYKLSALYTKNYDLPRTLLITGTNEIFYDDIREYHEKLVKHGQDVDIIIGENLFHTYPLYPIPEAWKVLKEIKKEVNRVKTTSYTA